MKGYSATHRVFMVPETDKQDFNSNNGRNTLENQATSVFENSHAEKAKGF